MRIQCLIELSTSQWLRDDVWSHFINGGRQKVDTLVQKTAIVGGVREYVTQASIQTNVAKICHYQYTGYEDHCGLAVPNIDM